MNKSTFHQRTLPPHSKSSKPMIGRADNTSGRYSSLLGLLKLFQPATPSQLVKPSQRFAASTSSDPTKLPSFKLSLIGAGLISGLLLGGCQPATSPTDSESVTDSNKVEAEKRAQPDLKQSPGPDAVAQINKYEPLYVEQMLSLQQRLQAEYESLEAADGADEITSEAGAKNKAAPLANEADASPSTADQASKTSATKTMDANNNATNANSTQPKQQNDAKTKIANENISTEVGERDLEVLKKISLEPQAPEILSEEQIKARYRDAMQALYAEPMLSAEVVDTLINITTLLPDIFEEAELARQLNSKSPALTRLIVQQQIWRQIEAQQVKDMQQMKIEQQAEFETLMAKFNETIQGYDEQIAKYEEMLKEFDRK